MGISVDRTTELSDEVLTSVEEGQRAAIESLGRFVITLEEALPQEVECRGIRHVHQDKAPDDRVKWSVGRSVVYIADNKPNVWETTFARARGRLRNGIRRLIDPDDRARRTHQLGPDERDIPRP